MKLKPSDSPGIEAATGATQTYSLRDIRSMLGISAAVIRSLVASGFVIPRRGTRREYRFSFQDVVVLRTAHSLQAAQIPSRRILRSLRRLKAALPDELPMSGLRITAVGSEIAVREGSTQWHVDSGQLLMDFEVAAAQNTIRFLTRAAERPPRQPSDWFDRGIELEATDRNEAEAAYRRAIADAPDYVDPYLNLGVMLCDAKRFEDAVRLYREALGHCPEEPLVHFNLAVALEDLQRIREALACYESCIEVSPGFADAHYNAARLHQRLGHASRALRHYSEYRRLQR